MPTYDYYCAANGRTVEVKHRMSETVHNWGELCKLAGIAPDGAAPETPVQRLATGGQVVSKHNLGSGKTPPCGGGGCGGGMCGFN